MEQLYTIPVNEAFDATVEGGACTCPLCTLHAKLEENELDLILGASMMEPDVRQKTNVEGFCDRHYGMMFARKNRLGLGLILESHLSQVQNRLSGEGLAALFTGAGADVTKKLGKLEDSCYICGRIHMHFSRMFDTVILLYRTDSAFRNKFAAQPFFCLPHYRRLLDVAKGGMNKKEFSDFYAAASAIEKRYAATLSEDVSWFCKKFDYRYQDEPWKNAKDAIERSIAFLNGAGIVGGTKK